LDSNERYVRFTGRLCVATGAALVLVALVEVVQGHVPNAAVWSVAGAALLVWGGWRLKSAKR
jgi:hypothetical protein